MNRLGRGVAAVAVVALAVGLSGCGGGASEAEDTACKLFVAAENDVTEAINLWKADGSPEGGSDLARQRGAERTSRVTEAAERATGDLAVEMSEAVRLAELSDATGSEDAGVAYLLQVQTVIETCQELGADIEVTEAID